MVQLIALMDVSAIRLSVLTMDNGRQRRLSNSHVWADATELIMNLSEIRPLFKYVSAGCPGCTRLHRIMWRQEPFSHLNRLLNPLFFHVLWGLWLSCVWRIRNLLIKLRWMWQKKWASILRLLMLQNPNNAGESKEPSWIMKPPQCFCYFFCISEI